MLVNTTTFQGFSPVEALESILAPVNIGKVVEILGLLMEQLASNEQVATLNTINYSGWYYE